MSINKKDHWENVYETKTPDQVSWTQEIPFTSLQFIKSFNLSKTAKIIDIGGGDSKFVDHLISEGYKNISVLDISQNALNRAKKRLGKNAERVTWIHSDITEFQPSEKYDIWHDRATFHFLTTDELIRKYKQITEENVTGYLAIGTFSENGPKKCSGLNITQYTENSLSDVFKSKFEKLESKTENHITPFDTTQNFIFCSFKRKN